MADGTKEAPKGPVIHEMLWFPGTTQEMIDTFPRLLARQNDIFINTYPKAGKYKKNSCRKPHVVFIHEWRINKE